MTQVLAGVLLGVFGLLVFSAVLADEETTTISGEVEAAEYDDDGNVTSVGIFDDEWGWVLIANTGKGKELVTHVGAEVTATGKIEDKEIDGDEVYVMTVSSFKVEDPAPSEDDYDDWDPEE